MNAREKELGKLVKLINNARKKANAAGKKYGFNPHSFVSFKYAGKELNIQLAPDSTLNIKSLLAAVMRDNDGNSYAVRLDEKGSVFFKLVS